VVIKVDSLSFPLYVRRSAARLGFSPRGRPPGTPQPVSAAVSLAPPPPVSLGGQLPPASPVVSVESYVPSYRLSREVYTIPDLWREWTVGLAVGLPSIDDRPPLGLSLGLPKRAPVTPHARLSSTESGGALLAMGRSRPWLGWKRSDW
jgi:hypothetical protein